MIVKKFVGPRAVNKKKKKKKTADRVVSISEWSSTLSSVAQRRRQGPILYLPSCVYSSISFSQGVENCAALDSSQEWKWIDLNCATSRGILCEVVAGMEPPTTAPPPTPPPK
jgi:hypothetical protein